MTRDAGFHHDAAGEREQSVAAEREPPTPESRAAKAGRLAGTRLRSGMARPLRSAQHLVDEAFGLAGADAARANAVILAGAAHPQNPGPGKWAVPPIPSQSLVFCLGAARDPTEWHGERQARSRAWMASGDPLLSSRHLVVLPSPPPPSSNPRCSSPAPEEMRHRSPGPLPSRDSHEEAV